jgi:hypothetical protein
MPTAESAAFLAKKPTVPPTFEGVDFEDNVAVHNARDAIIREQWVRSMMARLVGEELGKCYAREGVNHLEKCGVFRGKFYSFSFHCQFQSGNILIQWKPWLARSEFDRIRIDLGYLILIFLSLCREVLRAHQGAQG